MLIEKYSGDHLISSPINQPYITRIILGMDWAIDRRRYNITSSPIGWTQGHNDPCVTMVAGGMSSRAGR